MNKILKLTGILFALCLLSLSLTGCDGSSVLSLYIDKPANGDTVNNPAITVSGHLGGTQSASAKVTVNGADVAVKDLKFSTDVKLTEGKNVINVNGATSAGYELKEQVTVTYTTAK